MKLAKELVKAIGTRFGYDVDIRRGPARLRPDAHFGLNVLGYLVEELVAKRGASNLSLLQVGANDGRDEDPVHQIVERHQIATILCEPIADTFCRLVQTYRDFGHVRLAQCAIADHDGELELFRLAPDGLENRDEFSKVASIDRSHVERFGRFWQLPQSSIVSEIVPCRTVASLLADFGLDSVDIAVVDTEGMDHLICSQMLALNTPPSILQFEYSSAPADSLRVLLEDLTKRGYVFARSGLDITAASTALH